MLDRLVPVYLGDSLVGEDSDNALLLIVSLLMMLVATLKKRYFVKRCYRRRLFYPFDRDRIGETDSGTGGPIPHLNEAKFMQKYHMERPSFEKLVLMLQDNDVFCRGRRGPAQAPAANQLMVFFHRIGLEGPSGSTSNLRNLFGVAKGTVDVYFKRSGDAVLSLKHKYYFWPDKEERNAIAHRIEAAYQLPNCVGFMDVTLLPLAQKPQTDDFPDYSGRKFAYSMSTLIVADDQRRIRYHQSGWPGSSHDNRIFKDCKLYKKPKKYFTDNEYLLGDSAFECQPFMVSTYRTYAGKPLTPVQTKFNSIISSPCAISEHTIGIWKARFPFLKKLSNKITNSPASNRDLIKTIEASIILHNFLMEENDKVPDQWLVEGRHGYDNPPIAEDDEINLPVDGLPFTIRREQLTAYIDDPK